MHARLGASFRSHGHQLFDWEVTWQSCAAGPLQSPLIPFKACACMQAKLAKLRRELLEPSGGSGAGGGGGGRGEGQQPPLHLLFPAAGFQP